VVDGHSGQLAASEDEFARAWAMLAADRAHREALGRQARARAAGFPWSSTVARFAEVAEEALAWAPRRAGLPLAPLAAVEGAADR
jgi:hypothetical protein